MRQSNLIVYITASLIFLRTLPYVIWPAMIAFPATRFIIDFLIIICFVLHRDLKSYYRVLMVVLFLSILIFLWVSKTTIITVLVLLLFIFIPFSKDKFCCRVYDIFLKTYVIVIGLSLVAWVFSFIFEFPNFGTVVAYNDENRTYVNYGIFLKQLLSLDLGLEAFRFSGVYDEPGWVGTINTVLLCINKFNLKKLDNFILFLSGLFSFSLYFYVFLIFYGIYYIFKSKNMYVLLTICSIVLFLYLYTKENEFIYQSVWNRFEWNSKEGRFEGDSRTVGVGGSTDVETFYEKIKWTNQYWWGVDNKEAYSELAKGTCTYKTIVALYGMAFFSLYCAFFVLLGLYSHKKRKDLLLYLFIFLSLMYQRPFVFDPLWFFLLTIFIKRDLLAINDNPTLESKAAMVQTKKALYC